MGQDWDFPGSPVIKTPCFQEAWVRFQGGELRSHMPHGIVKIIKQNGQIFERTPLQKKYKNGQ